MAADNPSDNARTRVVDSGAPLALASGTLLGRYRVDGVLGQGGFGITYRATDTALNRAVAIKEYLPSDVAIRVDGTTVIPRSRTDAEDYDWGLKRFLDEAKTLAQHEAVPNVVRVYDFVEANGTAYMVMALVEGENLSSILRQRGTLSEGELRGIVLPLLDGLEQLHEAGLIHRDIKPANIILRGGRTPTLIDFGAAREGLGRKSRSVTSILTPGYAPFEQYGSAGDQGPWTDIYALAATIYHGIAGKAPPDSVDRIRRDPMVPAVQVGAGSYGESFLAAIDAGLKVDERERPQNAAQWRELFGAMPSNVMPPVTQPTTIPQPAVEQPISQTPISQPISRRPVSQPISQRPVSQSPASQPAPSLRPATTIEPPPPPSIMAAPPAARGSRKMLVAAGAAVLLIGGGVAVALTTGGSPQTAQPDQASVQLAEVEKKRVAELEKKLADEAESRKKLEAQVAETEAKRKAEEEARRKAAEEARLKAESEARERAEAETRRRFEEDTRKKVEAEFKARAEEEARKRADEEAKRKADEAKKKAEDDAKKKVEDEAKKKAEDEARKKAEQKPASPAPQQQQVAPAPSGTQQAAAPAPVVDRAAFEAQYGSTLRQRAEQALRARSDYTDSQTGSTVYFLSLNSVNILQITPSEVVVQSSYQTRERSGFNRTQFDRAQLRFKNQPPSFPLIAAGEPVAASSAPAAPTAQNQVAAAAAAPDAAAYVAQHWSVMKPKIETALRQRGAITDTVSGGAMRFDQIYNYRVVYVTPAHVALAVTYRNVRAVPGGGNMTGTSADITETATFQNQAPDFPLVSLK